MGFGRLPSLSNNVYVYVYMFICLKEGRYQYNDMCDASDVIEYGRGTLELSKYTTLHEIRHH